LIENFIKQRGVRMSFVKLDCGILDSTIWVDRPARELFITALLMAEPITTDAVARQIAVRELNLTGWEAPPGNYGFVPAAGVGIIGRAGVDMESGLNALERLGAPEPDSRSSEHGGRRMIRVDGGYLVLNYAKYRDRDVTAAERQRRWREKKKLEHAQPAPGEKKNRLVPAPPEFQVEDKQDHALPDSEEPNPTVSDEVKLVFSEWQRIFNSPKSRLDPKRARLIKYALKWGYSPQDLIDACKGCSVTPHNMGINDRGEKYIGLHVILRSSDQIERFIANHQDPPKPKNEAELRWLSNLNAAQQFVQGAPQ
jgi:hypothetical protein